MKALDVISKVGLLIIAIAFVAIYFLSSPSARYTYVETENGYRLFDTKTGVISIYYSYKDDTLITRYDIPNNKITFRKPKFEDEARK